MLHPPQVRHRPRLLGVRGRVLEREIFVLPAEWHHGGHDALYVGCRISCASPWVETHSNPADHPSWFAELPPLWRSPKTLPIYWVGSSSTKSLVARVTVVESQPRPYLPLPLEAVVWSSSANVFLAVVKPLLAPACALVRKYAVSFHVTVMTLFLSQLAVHNL